MHACAAATIFEAGAGLPMLPVSPAYIAHALPHGLHLRAHFKHAALHANSLSKSALDLPSPPP